MQLQPACTHEYPQEWHSRSSCVCLWVQPAGLPELICPELVCSASRLRGIQTSLVHVQAVNSGILGGFSAFDVRALSEGHHQELQRLRNARAQQATQAAVVSQQQQQQQQLLQQQLLRQNQVRHPFCCCHSFAPCHGSGDQSRCCIQPGVRVAAQVCVPHMLSDTGSDALFWLRSCSSCSRPKPPRLPNSRPRLPRGLPRTATKAAPRQPPPARPLS